MLKLIFIDLVHCHPPLPKRPLDTITRPYNTYVLIQGMNIKEQ